MSQAPYADAVALWCVRSASGGSFPVRGGRCLLCSDGYHPGAAKVHSRHIPLAPHPTSRHFPTRIWPQCLCVVAFCIAMTAHCPILPVEAVLMFAALCKVESGTVPVAECEQGGLQAGLPLHSGLSLWKGRGGRHCRAHKRHAGTSQQLLNIIANGPPTCSTPATGLASSHTGNDAEAMHVPSLLYSPTAKLPTPTPIIPGPTSSRAY
jgi:hypothetical protein